MGRKWLWFNRRPQSRTALFKTHAPCVVRWPQLAPVSFRAFLYINSAVICWAHIVNMACSSAYSKEFSRKELQSLLSSVLDNLDDGKVKQLSDEQLKALLHFLNRPNRRTGLQHPVLAVARFQSENLRTSFKQFVVEVVRPQEENLLRTGLQQFVVEVVRPQGKNRLRTVQ